MEEVYDRLSCAHVIAKDGIPIGARGLVYQDSGICMRVLAVGTVTGLGLACEGKGGQVGRGIIADYLMRV